MTQQVPSIGRMVHFVYGDSHYAAVITQVHHSSGLVSLTVFPPDDQPFTTVAQHDGVTFDPATWHWMEYVAPVGE